jgi:myosin heavy subunit
METRPSDLVNLTTLDPSAIVDTLRHRHENNTPYTMCSGVLISVNPQQWLPLYKETTRRIYMAGGEKREPHPYILTARALKCVRHGDPHTLLITGESGAGKTEMARICLEFINSYTRNNSSQIERILKSGEVLEYIGNAQTIRNHNSSRFGKFLRLFYDGNQQCGASIQTYLLERGRIANNNIAEGTFRVVYALLNDTKMRDTFALHAIDRNVFGKTDAAFQSSWAIFSSVLISAGFAEQVIIDIAATISGTIFLLTRDFASASQVLGVETQKLTHVLRNRRTKVKDETIWSECSNDGVRQRSKALAMTIYTRMFNQTVLMLNDFIGGTQTGTSLNLLDIFGFEALASNGLEQLCINYCNERIQTLFINEVIVQQQLEYANEGIECSHIEFDGNRRILELCERCVFVKLDESTRLRGSPEGLVETIKAQSPTGFSVPLVRKDGPVFTIEHYAKPVLYNADMMIERNTNEIRSEIVEVMCDASNAYIANLFVGESDNSNDGKMWTATITSVFCEQMKKLTADIATTQSLYIRCIRPNETTVAIHFDDAVVSEQIAANGILHACKVMRNGYEFRMKHKRFADHFPKLYARGSSSLRAFGVFWGETMVYMSASCHERVRREEAALVIQPYAHEVIRRSIKRVRATIMIQSVARRRMKNAAQVFAARLIQRVVRHHNTLQLARLTRWKRFDEIERLKAQIIDLRRQLKEKNAWIFRASQILRHARPDVTAIAP